MSGGIKKINYYMLFGIKPSASDEIIKKKYRILAKQFHPDSKTGNEEHFKLINEAYNVLRDPQLRAEYNIKLYSGSLSNIDKQEKNCLMCDGNGFWVKKVPYGRYKVDSKIVCTLCSGSGIIINIEK